MKEIMEDYSAEKADLAKRLQDAIRSFFPYLILIINIAFLLLSRIFAVGFQNPFSAQFFIQLASNILTTMFCYVTYVSYGERTGKLLPSFIDNCNAWAKLSGTVRAGMNEAFETYCNDMVEKERESIRRARILNHSMIPYEVYLSDYKGKPRGYIRMMVRGGRISAKDARVVNWANRSIRLKPVRPLLILCGVAKATTNDAGREKPVSYATVSIVSRPLLMFLVSALSAAISSPSMGQVNAAMFYDIVWSCISIVMACFAGFDAGSISARKDADKVKARIFFIENFLEAEKAKA